ncbi:Retrovirus-related Pol polyprotein from transposon 17.6 [Nosema granulosis]|uniref:Retrovirus-related Pol polyprotein from transposon 17.6 n=1 Tax=Nosema granulosis TaxID=83296 RepID=A0A9P6GYB6_9MICR|nr:Retrovirus-related Pol polyprotein from transposon 17.6 [Nosema granulosis]
MEVVRRDGREIQCSERGAQKKRPLKIPDYRREFRLKTDECDTGLDAVLLRKNKEEKWVLIQRESKLTNTEKRYTISEKEMLAVVWAVEKFSYELRGRRFELMTDHKALEEIRNKPFFNNNRINRWIERIHEFYFTVLYVKGQDMTDADALSRQFQKEKTGMEIRREKMVLQQKAGKERKHKIVIEGKEYCEFSSGERAEIPKKQNR